MRQQGLGRVKMPNMGIMGELTYFTVYYKLGLGGVDPAMLT